MNLLKLSDKLRNNVYFKQEAAKRKNKTLTKQACCINA